MTIQQPDSLRKAIMDRICTRWHGGFRELGRYLHSRYTNEAVLEGIKNLQTTADLYHWLEVLSDQDLIDVLDSQACQMYR